MTSRSSNPAVPLKRRSRHCSTCHYYGAKTELHHIKPRAEGGLDDDKNLIELCLRCHDQAEEYGWAWIHEQWAKRTEKQQRAIPVDIKEQLRPGEHLGPDGQAWGRDKKSLYARELLPSREMSKGCKKLGLRILSFRQGGRHAS